MLDELPDEEVVAVARRALERLADRFLLDVENALLQIESEGIVHVSEVTRLALANALDGRRLHPTEDASASLGRFARASGTPHRFEYAEDGTLVEVEVDIFGLFGTGPSRPQTVSTSPATAS